MSKKSFPERFSIAPIMSAARLQTVGEFAAAAGVTRKTVHRWMRSGVDVWTADTLSCKVAQLHPYTIFGDAWFADTHTLADEQIAA